MRRFNLISNCKNGAGLERDCSILKALLESHGEQATLVQFDGMKPAPPADINLFVEILQPSMFKAAPEQWLIPNPEWFFEPWMNYLRRPNFRYVLCKTQDAVEQFLKRSLHQGKLKMIGFTCVDMYDASVSRTNGFLHAAGRSQTKNTTAIIEAWRRFSIPAPLTVISRSCIPTQGFGNITIRQHVSEGDLRKLMNENLFHIMPSAYEGYGHSLHEGMSCGAIVLTTNKPPMNAFGTPPQLLIDSWGNGSHHLAPLWRVEASAIQNKVREAMRLPQEELDKLRCQARATYLKEKADFEKNFFFWKGQ